MRFFLKCIISFFDDLFIWFHKSKLVSQRNFFEPSFQPSAMIGVLCSLNLYVIIGAIALLLNSSDLYALSVVISVACCLGITYYWVNIRAAFLLKDTREKTLLRLILALN